MKLLLIITTLFMLFAGIATAVAPTVSLVGPADGSTDNDGDITFDYTATDDGTLNSCSLYHDNGGWGVKETDNSPSQGANNFVVSGFGNGSAIIWNVECGDNETLSSFAPANFTVNVDIPPSATFSVSPSTLSLGGPDQPRSNPRHDRDEDRTVFVSGIFTIQNTGTETLTDLRLDNIATFLGFSTTDLNISATISQTTLAQGDSAQITVFVRVPEDLDAVDSNFNPTGFDVASLSFAADSTGSGTISNPGLVNLQAENNLKITDLDGKVDDERTKSLDEGDTLKNAKPGSIVKIVVEVENKFRDKEDVDIEDVEVDVIIDQGDLDIDENDDLGDLAPDDKENVEFLFDVEDDADEDDYAMEITVQGTDQNGAKHGERINVELQVERNTHDIEIRSMTLSPETVTCGGSTELKINMRNIGTRDEDEVTIRLESPELSFGDVINDIILDENDATSETFIVPVPDTTSPGSYRVTIETFYDSDRLSDRDAIIVRKALCQTEIPPVEPVEPDMPEQTEGGDETIVIVPTEPDGTSSGDGGQEIEPSGSIFGSPLYLILLVLINIVIIAVVIWLISMITKK